MAKKRRRKKRRKRSGLSSILGFLGALVWRLLSGAFWLMVFLLRSLAEFVVASLKFLLTLPYGRAVKDAKRSTLYAIVNG